MIKFGSRYKNHPTPKAIKFWFKMGKRVCAVLLASSVIMEHQYIALTFGILAGVLDEAQEYFGVQTPPTDAAV